MLWKALHVPWPPTKFPDPPGCEWFQTFRVSCINALLLFRCHDLFLVGKIGYPRTASLVSLVVAGMPGLTEALDKQDCGMLAWTGPHTSSPCERETRPRPAQQSAGLGISPPCWRGRHTLPTCYHFSSGHRRRPASYPVAIGGSRSIFRPGGTTTFSAAQR